MAFEPLKTDEKFDGHIEKKPDFDSQMLFGCGAFLITSVFGYLMVVWPFFIFPTIEKLQTLGLDLGLGLVPWCIFLILMMRKGGLAAGCGGLGGSLSTAVFLYLRLQQPFISWRLQQIDKPEYPEAFIWLVPLAIPMLSIVLALFFLKKEEIDVNSS